MALLTSEEEKSWAGFLLATHSNGMASGVGSGGLSICHCTLSEDAGIFLLPAVGSRSVWGKN